MYILGINALYHESAACLVQDGSIVAVAEEERYNRKKHGKLPRPDNADELPVQAIHYCLVEAGIDLGQVEHIVYSSDPYGVVLKSIPEPIQEIVIAFEESQLRVPIKLRNMGFTGELTWLDHHVAHAASAFYAAPFHDAAILAVDGVGNFTTTGCYWGVNNQIRGIQEIAYPHSIGFLWELMSVFLGFEVYDAAKIMGLAAYGNPDRYAAQFKKLAWLVPDGNFAMDDDILRFWMIDYDQNSGYYDGLEALFGMKKREPDQELDDTHHDIAAALQKITDDIVLHMVEHAYAKTRSENLCLAGGVALNCVTNHHVFEHGPFTNLYVQPAAHDAGTALGAALYLWYHRLGKQRGEWMPHAYFGPSFTNADIARCLQDAHLRYTPSANIEQEVAQLLSQGNVVGFFQGRMEYGPRALGNRSLLADPRNPNMREILNHKVKHREYFRPFAPSVLAEEAHNWFEIGKPTVATDFMLMAYPTKADRQAKIPAVVHADGTSRIQTVRAETNPRYHKLISAFYALTGVPVVLNTSFNDSEPIVCTPQDAIATFMKTEIDYLAIGDFLVSKAENRPVTS